MLQGNIVYVNWNATLLALLGTKGVVFIYPDNSNTFAPYCDTGYVVGRAPCHYLLLGFYIPAIRGCQRRGAYQLYLTHYRIPSISEVDQTVEAVADLLKEIKNEISKISTR